MKTKIKVYCENEFLQEIDVELEDLEGERVLSFGGPMRYRFNEEFKSSIKENCGEQGKEFNIDIGGRLFGTDRRRDPSVYVKAEDMLKLVNIFE